MAHGDQARRGPRKRASQQQQRPRTGRQAEDRDLPLNSVTQRLLVTSGGTMGQKSGWDGRRRKVQDKEMKMGGWTTLGRPSTEREEKRTVTAGVV